MRHAEAVSPWSVAPGVSASRRGCSVILEVSAGIASWCWWILVAADKVILLHATTCTASPTSPQISNSCEITWGFAGSRSSVTPRGRAIALTYAAEHPECVERLVLVGAAARFADDHEEVAATMRAARWGEPWYRDAAAVGEAIARADRSMTNSQLGALLARGAGFCFARYGPRQAAYAALLRDEGVNVAAWLAGEDEEEDLRPLLPHIIAPTLVVAGEEDCVVAPVASQDLAEGLPHGRIVVLADAGHDPWVD